jgi:FAD synthase
MIQRLKVRFLHKIRDEISFKDIEQLKGQLVRDARDTLKWLDENDPEMKNNLPGVDAI